jgi:murein DD-endopeptidase MepM/ murein hydrolase activator NlpD
VDYAKNMNGYGLTVILRHNNETQESLHAHMSAIFVREGEWVEQGTVIGLVGTTGWSTGPHLHFEWRQKTNTGWVAVDSGFKLELARQRLVNSLSLSQQQSQISMNKPPEYHRAPRSLKEKEQADQSNSNQSVSYNLFLPQTITSVLGWGFPLTDLIAYRDGVESNFLLSCSQTTTDREINCEPSWLQKIKNNF